MKYLFFAAAGIFLLDNVQSDDASPREDEKLAATFKSFLDEEFKARPMSATRAGDHRFDHLLDDLSPKARAAYNARLKNTLNDLPGRIDYKKLSRAGQIDFEIFEHYLKEQLWLADNTDRFENDPRIYTEIGRASCRERVYVLV